MKENRIENNYEVTGVAITMQGTTIFEPVILKVLHASIY